MKVKGGKPLKGKVRISSAKNSVLKLMAASILADSTVEIKNAPDIFDVNIMCELLKGLGATVVRQNGSILIEPEVRRFEADYELVSKMRASILVLGPLLAKYGKARVALPGGCNIGHRKIDFHLEGLRALGAKIKYDAGFIVGEASKLKGTFIHLPMPSVGATENLLMASCLAEGNTVIENAAREPEIVDLANFLIKMGAKIKGAGSSRIEVEGVQTLKGISYLPIPDRIEAGTFIAASLITNGEVLIENLIPEHLSYVLQKFEEAGAKFEVFGKSIKVLNSGRLSGVDIATFPYPGFPTDLQPLAMALLSVAKGVSVITENIFDNRFLHADELVRMGAHIEINGKHAIIYGVEKLYGVPVRAMDLRGGAALVIAGLAAEGETLIYDAYHIFRGYENFVNKLRGLGVEVEIEIN